MFFPLLTLLSIDLRVSSIKACRHPGMKRRGLEAGLMALHLVAYVTALLLGWMVVALLFAFSLDATPTARTMRVPGT